MQFELKLLSTPRSVTLPETKKRRILKNDVFPNNIMSASNESSFRSSLNNIGWSRRTADPDLSTAQPSFLQRINPFGQSGYIRLPTSSQDLPAQLPAQSAQQENAAWFALSQWERLLVFGCCVLGAAACFVMAFVLMPVLVLKPRKFVILWTVGSVLFLCRFLPPKSVVDV